MLRYREDVLHSAVIAVDLTIYGMPALLRTLYRFTADFFVYVARRAGTSVDVYLTSKEGAPTPLDLAGRFVNALLDEQLRCVIAEETRAVRELIVAEAFAASGLIDDSEAEADYHADPRRIAS
jgi:His-Xaa-Ser system protein HxsD